MNLTDPPPGHPPGPSAGGRDKQPRRRWTTAAGLVLACLSLAGAVLLVRYLFPPTPPLVGTWENDRKIFDAQPGEVRLVLNRDGTGELHLARNLFFLFDKFTYRVQGDVVELHPVRDETKKRLLQPSDELRWQFQVKGDRLRVVGFDGDPLPEDQVMVFRRVRGSSTVKSRD
jgi:hypothetical protein